MQKSFDIAGPLLPGRKPDHRRERLSTGRLDTPPREVRVTPGTDRGWPTPTSDDASASVDVLDLLRRVRDDPVLKRHLHS